MMLDLQNRLARDYWHLVAHKSEISKPGDFIRLDWTLGEIVVFNDNGEIIIFDNLCPHRGARFYTDDTGSKPAVCPYHGWSYRFGTMQVARPELFESNGMHTPRLNIYRSAWCGQFLFVGLEPHTSLREQLGSFADSLVEISADIEKPVDLHTRRLALDWRVLTENALESYHLPMVHSSTLARLSLTEEEEDFTGDNSCYIARIGAARIERALSRISRHFDARHAFEGYRCFHVFPFAMISSTFGLSYAVQSYFPSTSYGQTHFRSRLFATRTVTDSEHVTAYFLNSTSLLNQKVFEEDAEICARVSNCYNLNAPDRLFGINENRVAHFVRALGRFQQLISSNHTTNVSAG